MTHLIVLRQLEIESEIELGHDEDRVSNAQSGEDVHQSGDVRIRRLTDHVSEGGNARWVPAGVPLNVINRESNSRPKVAAFNITGFCIKFSKNLNHFRVKI